MDYKITGYEPAQLFHFFADEHMHLGSSCLTHKTNNML